MLGQEGAMIPKTILPTLYYVAFAGILGLIAIFLLTISDLLVGTIPASSGVR